MLNVYSRRLIALCTAVLCACGVPSSRSSSSASGGPSAATGKSALKQQLLHLTRDLRTDVEPGEIELDRCAPLGTRAICTIWEPVTGTELWVTDGTAAGTHLIKDLVPGEDGYLDAGPVAMGDAVYFVEELPGTYGRLFRTDGTAEGTKQVPTEGDLGVILELAAVGNTLYLSAEHGTLGSELWKTDGVHAPVLVKDVYPGSSGSQPRNLTAVGDRLFFIANEPATGSELHVTDGTSAGTRLVKDLTPGTSSWFDWTANGNELVAFGNTLLFRAHDPQHGWELWRSDGTDAGTAPIVDLNPGTANGMTTDTKTITVMGGAAYFLGNSPATGFELFRTDGTADGTTVLVDLLPGAPGSYPAHLATNGTRLFFVGHDEAHGREPWVSDGTPEGTRLLADLDPGQTGSLDSVGDQLFIPFGEGKVLFTASSAEFGAEPFVTDGTPEGTHVVKDLVEGSDSSVSTWGLNVAVAGNRAVFAAWDPDDNGRLWSTDGTADGTQMILDPKKGTASLFTELDLNAPRSPFLPLGDKVLFVANANDGTGNELYVSDGTEQGTHLIKDLSPGDNGQSGQFSAGLAVVFNGAVLFTGNDGNGSDMELWRTDGTADGTYRVADLNPGASANGFPYGYVECNGAVYFAANRADVGQELFKTDGTEAGTQLVADVIPGTGSSSPSNLACANHHLVFTAEAPNNAGRELFVSDGTSAGTQLFDLAPGTGRSNPMWLTAAGDFVYFAADLLNGTGSELYRIKPGAGAPELVRELVPGSNGGFDSSDPEFTAVGDTLFFVANGPGLGRELWVTDGTWEGTQLMADVVPGLASGNPHALTAAGDKLLFIANDGQHGDEVWVSRGTPTSTRLVKDVFPGPQSGTFYGPMTAVPEKGMAFFSGVDPEGGVELWRTDGTEAGTVRVEDAVAGVGSLEPFMPTRAGSRIYFQGFTKETGREVWSGAVADLVDQSAPGLSCPAELKVEAVDASGANVALPVIDVADADVQTDRTSGMFPMGRTPVHVVATDAVGNQSACTFDVVVADTTAPALSCPADVTVDASKDGAAEAMYAATATDAVTASPEVLYSVAPGTRLPVGVTSVSVRARDAAGNEAKCAFNVTVQKAAAGCSATGASASLWPLVLGFALLLVSRRRRAEVAVATVRVTNADAR